MKPLSFLTQYFCFEGLMVIAGFAALVVSIVNRKRHSSLRIFIYYIAFSLLQTACAFYEFMSPKEQFIPKLLLAIATLLFMLFEYVVCVRYVFLQITSLRRRRIVKATSLGYIAATTLVIVFRMGYFNLLLVDCIFLTLPCFFYFYELFVYVQEKPLKDDPSFWIITGILFLNCCSIPLYLAQDLLGKYGDKAFSLNYLLYTLLFSLLIRAYVCSPENKYAGIQDRKPVRLKGKEIADHSLLVQ